MPSVAAIIGGTVTLLIGTFVLFNFKDYGDYSEKTSFRMPWESWKHAWYYRIGAFMVGLALMGLGLNTLKFGALSIVMLIPALVIIFRFKPVGKILMVFFSRHEPSPGTIVKAQYCLLVLVLAWSVWAVYLSVVEWV